MHCERLTKTFAGGHESDQREKAHKHDGRCNANKGALVSETQTARAAQHMRAVVHGSKIILCMQAVPRSATPKRMCHRERRALRSHLTCSCQSVLRILFPSLLRLSYWSVVGRIESNRIESNRIESNRIESNRIESNNPPTYRIEHPYRSSHSTTKQSC